MDTLICGMDFRCINLFSHLWHGFAIISATLIGGMVSPQRLVFIYGMGFRRVFSLTVCGMDLLQPYLQSIWYTHDMDFCRGVPFIHYFGMDFRQIL